MKKILLTLTVLLGAMLQGFSQNSSWQSGETKGYVSFSRGIYTCTKSKSMGNSYALNYTKLFIDDIGYSVGLDYINDFDYSTDIVRIPLGIRCSFDYVQDGTRTRFAPATRYVIDHKTRSAAKVTSPITVDAFFGIVPAYISTNTTLIAPVETNAFNVEHPLGCALDFSIGLGLRVWRVKFFANAAMDYYLTRNFSYQNRRRGGYNYHVHCSVGMAYML